MAISTFNGGFYFPDRSKVGSYLLYNYDPMIGLTIDAPGEKVAFIFIAPKTGNIDRVFAYVLAKTTNGTLDVSLQAVNASDGKPSGTDLGAGTFSNTTANQTIDVTLGSSVAVTRGVQYALVISQNAGNCTIQVVQAVGYYNGLVDKSRSVYVLQNTGSYDALSAANPNTYLPCTAFRYDDGNYYFTPGVACASTFSSIAFNNTSTTRERGLAFTLPFPQQITGFFFLGQLHNTDCDIILADSSGTLLLTYSTDKDIGSYYSSYSGTYSYYFSSTYNTASNTKYYLTIKPLSASDVYIHEITLISGSSIPAQMGMWNGGTAAYLVTKDSGGTPTETTTRRPVGMGIICSGFDDGAGPYGGPNGFLLGR